MNKVSFLRHAGWVGPEDLNETLTIIGCGAVGSNLALIAAKMGFHNFSLWDADIVEPHNLPNQAYDVEHIGMKKVAALEAVLKRFNPSVSVKTHDRHFTSADKDEVVGPMVIATDTMSSRRDFYDAFYLNAQIDHVYEIRLGFDYGELNVVDTADPQECDSWLRSLRDDSEVPDGPCNLRICTTLVLLVSSYAVHTLCARYAAERAGEEWSRNIKTMFNLTPTLDLYRF